MMDLVHLFNQSQLAIEGFLELHYPECQIQDLLKFQEAFQMEVNTERIQRFIDRKQNELISIWAEE